MTTATPIGTLTRKIQCQLSVSVRTPPKRTPRLPPPAITKPKMPIAFARSACSVNRFIINESATAETMRNIELTVAAICGTSKLVSSPPTA